VIKKKFVLFFLNGFIEVRNLDDLVLVKSSKKKTYDGLLILKFESNDLQFFFIYSFLKLDFD